MCGSIPQSYKELITLEITLREPRTGTDKAELFEFASPTHKYRSTRSTFIVTCPLPPVHGEPAEQGVMMKQATCDAHLRATVEDMRKQVINRLIHNMKARKDIEQLVERTKNL